MAQPEIILYHYTFSPFAKRIVYYLTLRRIPYTQCLQPPYLPRPDVAAIGTSYRRIPILSIGRDIYNDTRLILSKLTLLFPPSAKHPSLSSPNSGSAAIERLLSHWTVEIIFLKAAALIPSSTPLMRDPKFLADREDFSGRSWKKEDVERNRVNALIDIRAAFEMLESTFLADGRRWILGPEHGISHAGQDVPSLADVEAVWPFLWLKGLQGALPQDVFNPDRFPKTYAWMKRFEDVVRRIRGEMGAKPKTIDGAEALRLTATAGFVEGAAGGEEEEGEEGGGQVDANDPSGLRKGEQVDVWPADTGFRHKDRGRLVKLNSEEIVVEKSFGGQGTVRVHAPRYGFRVVKATEQMKL